MQFSDDEFPFGPFANLSYALGRLEHPEFLGQRDLIQLSVIVDVARGWMERFGFRASASTAASIVEILDGTSPQHRQRPARFHH